jgi:hypothetical protein
MNGTPTAILTGLVAALLMVLSPAGATASGHNRVTCHSGHTVYQREHTRLFWANRGRSGAKHPVWYACSSSLRQPHPFLSGSHGTYDVLVHFRPFGDRVGFVWKHFAPIRFGQEVDSSIGWVDVTSGVERHTLLSSSNHDTGVPFGDVKAVAVGNDGAMAAIVRPADKSEVIGYAPIRPARLGDPRPLVTIDSGDVMPTTLEVAGDTVFWTSRSSGPSSALVLP